MKSKLLSKAHSTLEVHNLQSFARDGSNVPVGQKSGTTFSSAVRCEWLDELVVADEVGLKYF